MNNQINKNVRSAFDSLFDESETVYKAPWEKWNMSRAEWTKMYNKACDDSAKFRQQVETGKIFDEEVSHV